MADYKDLFGKLADKVKDVAETSGVMDVYAQGASRAKAFGQLTKLTVELNREQEELRDIYTEIGRLYYEQAKAAPEGVFVPLFEQASRITDGIRERRAKINELKEGSGLSGQDDIAVEIGDFDDVVSATEADGMTVEIKKDGE